MFVLTIIKDEIRVHPSRFGEALLDSLVEEIDSKYANRVFPSVGLCITIWDFVEVGEGKIYPGDGNGFVTVTFRMVVFRPFLGEVLEGRVQSMDETGIRVSLDFFSDVHLDSQLLPSPSSFNEATGRWVWHYEQEGPEEGMTSTDFPFEVDATVRVRVTAVQYSDAAGAEEAERQQREAALAEESIAAADAVAASGTSSSSSAAGRPSQAETEAGEEEARERAEAEAGGVFAGGEGFEQTAAKLTTPAAAMTVFASAAEEGLGLVAWWGDDGPDA